MRPPSGNRVTNGQHLSSKAIDYSASPDPYVYAPESGRITSYAQRGSGTNNAGNCLRLSGKTGLHQFAHLERTLVSVGSRVTKGQKIAVMGYTGYTRPSGPAGRHLHYWVKTSQGYVYPPRLYTEPFKKEETVTYAQKMTSAPMFDKAFYLAKYSDIRNHSYYGKHPDEHWLKYGIKEGRQPTRGFSPKEYLGNYGDLRRAYGATNYKSAVEHWYLHGIREGRMGRKKPTVVDKTVEFKEKIIAFVKGLK